MREIGAAIQQIITDVFNIDVEPELTRPDEQFGDYATNVALKLSKQLGKNPRDIAEAIADKLHIELNEQVSEVSIAGPGFINIRLTDRALIDAALNRTVTQKYQGQEILTEFGDANPLKAMHLGHLYTTIVGDTISSLMETAGATVRRLSYHGDVGMHVAKAIYGIGDRIDWDIHRLNELEHPEALDNEEVLTLKNMLGILYARGAQAFEESEEAQARIREINAHVYKKDDTTINAIYDWGVKRSFEYFDLIFAELGVQYDKRYLESQSTPIGLQSVNEHIGTVFEKSDNAVVYKGEKVGLHTRVFINSEGLPTYEAKDLGLVELKHKDYPNAAQSYIITANEQTEYFKVMLAALSEFDKPLAEKTHHIAHGFLSLTTGKMSSRTGKVFGAQELLDGTSEAVKTAYPDSPIQREVYLAAVKYTFLKSRIGGDIVFDVQESVTLEGNSGPYLQYAHARARSILAKVDGKPADIDGLLEKDERSLLRKLSEYPAVVERAVDELLPHHICTYLYELAQDFNRFYEHNRVIGDERQAVRVRLVTEYADVLQGGLRLLNIPAPERM
jgi:arginyl-tRNA synthetase